ncbi:MAG: hypothetical protein JNK72_15840 [Myxococcales bacterium]|nr:hypothetical protein [Myxococcales bacterium]
MTKTPLRSGAWTAPLRRKLSAIRVPHKADPRDFYYDADGAAAALADAGPVPSALTVAGEMARQKYLGSYRGVSWRTTTGRCFTDEYWNPLVALWVTRAGFDFALDRIVPDIENPWQTGLYDTDPTAALYALRRYLWRAPQAEFEAARRKAEPIFERCKTSDVWDLSRTASHLAYAFDRDPAWALWMLSAYNTGAIMPPTVDILGVVCPDLALTEAVVAKYGGFGPIYHVFDLVETLGSRSLVLLEKMTGGRAPDRKRVAAATAVAEALKAQGE